MGDWGRRSTFVEGEYYAWAGVNCDVVHPHPWPTEFDRPLRRLSVPREAVLGRGLDAFLDSSPGLEAAHIRNRMRAVTLPRTEVLDLRDAPFGFGQSSLTKAIVRAAQKMPIGGVVLKAPGGEGETVALWAPLRRSNTRFEPDRPAKYDALAVGLIDNLLLQAARLSKEIDRYSARLREQDEVAAAPELSEAFRADFEAVRWLHQDAAESSLSPLLFIFIRQLLAQLEVEHAAVVLRSNEIGRRLHVADNLRRRRRRTAVPALVELSQDDDLLTQTASAQALAALAHPSARERTRELFDHGEAVVRRSVLAEPNSTLGKSPELLEAAAKDDDPLIRLAAVETAARQERLSPTGRFADCVSDPDPLVRGAAIMGMDPKHPAAPGLFAYAISDSDKFVRRAAVRQMGRAKPSWALKALSEASDDPEEAVREAVTCALADLDNADAARHLLFMLVHDRSNAVRGTASAGLSRLSEPEALRILIELLDSNDPLFKQVRATFKRRRGEPALAAMVSILNFPPLAEGNDVLRSLVRKAPPEAAVDLIFKAVEQRRLACSTAAKLIEGMDKPPLTRLTEAALAESTNIRVTALLACAGAEIAMAEQVPLILYGLKSQDRQVRAAAWTAIRRKKGGAKRMRILRRIAQGSSPLALLAAETEIKIKAVGSETALR